MRNAAPPIKAFSGVSSLEKLVETTPTSATTNPNTTHLIC